MPLPRRNKKHNAWGRSSTARKRSASLSRDRAGLIKGVGGDVRLVEGGLQVSRVVCTKNNVQAMKSYDVFFGVLISKDCDGRA